MKQDRRVLKDYPWYHRTPRFIGIVLPIFGTLIFFSGSIYGCLTSDPPGPIDEKFDARKHFGGRTI